MQIISIVIATYNNEHSIVNTLMSIKRQTSDLWECVIIDDCSTDGTVATVRAEIAGYQRFRLFENRTVKGVGYCRNLGVDHCLGDYLVFLEPGNFLYNTCIEKRSYFIKGWSNIDVLVSHTTLFKDQVDHVIGSINHSLIETNYHDLINSLIRCCQIWTMSSVTWEKRFLLKIGKWSTKFESFSEMDLYIRGLLERPKLHFTKIEDSLMKIETSKSDVLQEIRELTMLLNIYFEVINRFSNGRTVQDIYNASFMFLIKNILRLILSNEIELGEGDKQLLFSILEKITDEEGVLQVRAILQ
ncbi:glycosyltransferase family 2 protein [Sphingobacterium sp. ML3W]|uniref:glycosyltransferase family 2 protein n=1 Tax=Sphingobacterium sp. ML3W TaxID=1538644 RepID=UPI00249BE3D1|nr:glycosyltransferase family 2 protein [Sphingobacterium sp. ML3W]WFA79540.1 glycosyltransferase family 2 protein [Sphingobacterium sp. ML3W]